MFKNQPGRRALGQEQEQRAREFLVRAGYEVLETNRFYPWGEIDLIAHAPWNARTHVSALVFIEVRSAGRGNWLDPRESITASKKRRLLRAIESYLLTYSGPATSVRVDLIACTLGGIQHYENFMGL
jgi:Holliday junction resolvase-like predicted endonuclease